MISLLLLLALASPPGGFACMAQGTKLIVPATGAEAACARVRSGLERAGALRGRDEIRVALRFEKPGIASAAVTRVRGGRAVQLPEISVAVSDRAIGPSTIDLLTREIAVRLGKR